MLTTETGNDGGSALLRLNDVCRIVSNRNMVENLCVATSKGAIKVLGMPSKSINATGNSLLRDAPEYTHQHLVAHHGDALHVKAAEDGFYAFSGGSDGIIFVYQVTEIEQTKDQKRPGMQGAEVTQSVAPSTANRGPEKTAPDEEAKDQHKVIQASMKGVEI